MMKLKDMIILGLVLVIIALVVFRSMSTMDANEITPVSKGNLIVFGTKTCPWCVKQEKYLTENGIPYAFVDCATTKCPEFVESFPTLMLNDQIMKGYTELGPESTYPSPSEI